uniref:Uncharacterized protein n=1 Tax=Zea mays TaxID=4577 RepID=C0PJI8_MAIZE|nr:unknown [Zea mays]|eukprot:NP_001169955.1 uncharacterized protein LOC100383854 [Zea mays]
MRWVTKPNAPSMSPRAPTSWPASWPSPASWSLSSCSRPSSILCFDVSDSPALSPTSWYGRHRGWPDGAWPCHGPPPAGDARRGRRAWGHNLLRPHGVHVLHRPGAGPALPAPQPTSLASCGLRRLRVLLRPRRADRALHLRLPAPGPGPLPAQQHLRLHRALRDRDHQHRLTRPHPHRHRAQAQRFRDRPDRHRRRLRQRHG